MRALMRSQRSLINLSDDIIVDAGNEILPTAT